MSRMRNLVFVLGLLGICGVTLLADLAALKVKKKDEDTITTATTATPLPRTKPLLHQMAPSIFSMNADTGLIDLPDEIDTVIIDVGARESDYLALLEARGKQQQFKDQPQTIALILVDPLPDSLMPLQRRVVNYALRNNNKQKLHPHYMNRVFAVNGAMAEQEGQMTFNVGKGAACSSLLNTSSTNTFWCAKSTRKIPVLVYTLADLLALIPQRPTITSMHLKVDAEGADLIVLKGAREAIERLDTVVIECKPESSSSSSSTQKTVFEGECYYDQARDYMATRGFDGAGAQKQGHAVNAYFWKQNNATVPEYLTKHPIVHRNLYTSIQSQLRHPLETVL